MDGSEFSGGEYGGAGHPLSSEVSQHVRQVLSEAEAAAGAMRHEAEQVAQQRRRDAEDEAREILADARRDGEALVQERIRRISDLSDTLLSRAETLVGRLERGEELRGQLQELVDSLGAAAHQLARDSQPRPEPAARVEPEPARDVPPEPRSDAELRVVREPAERPVEPRAAEPAESAETDADAEAVDAEPADVEPAEPEPVRAEAEPIPDAQVEDAQESRADENLAARLVALQMAVAGGNRGEVEGHLRVAFELDAPEDILNDVFGPGTGPETRVTWPEVVSDAGR